MPVQPPVQPAMQPPVQPVTAGPPGYGFVRLNQLAVEHLMGAR